MAPRRLPAFFVSLAFAGEALAQPAPAPEVAPAVAPPAAAEPSPAEPSTTDAASPEPTAPEPPLDPSAEEPPPAEDLPLAVEEPPPVAPVGEAPLEPAAIETEGSSVDEPIVRPPRLPTPFDQGRIRLGVVAGWAQASSGLSTTNWVILGVGGGYYVLDGLEPNVGTTFWIGDPFIATLTPGVNYVFHMVPTVKPYVGTFYRHYFVREHPVWDDTDSIGARLGVYFMIAPMSYFGGGIAYEHFLDENLYTSVDQFYPEITISISF